MLLVAVLLDLATMSLPAVTGVLWLPDDFAAMVARIIEQEEDRIHAGGLQRCLDSLHRQTLGASGIAQQIFVERGLPS